MDDINSGAVASTSPKISSVEAPVTASTGSTEIPTTCPGSPDRNSSNGGVDNELKQGMANLNVSPPRSQIATDSDVEQSEFTLTTPQNREGTGIASMTAGESATGAKGFVLPRQRSSPSLIDSSPPKPKDTASASKARTGQPPLSGSARIAYSPRPSPSITMMTTSGSKLAPNRPHHELTPVTRNTTYVSDEQYVENASSNLISPDEQQQAANSSTQQQEKPSTVDVKLAFPSSVKDSCNSTPPLQQRLSLKTSSSKDNQNTINQGSNNTGTAETPYLPPAIVSTASRVKSVGNLDSQSLMLASKQELGGRIDSWDYAADVEHELEDVNEGEEGGQGRPPSATHLLPRQQKQQQHPHDPPSAMYQPAVPFPSRKYYSFTSRQQYETSIQEDTAEMTGYDNGEGAFIVSTTSSNDVHQTGEVAAAGAPSFLRLKPYQPDRHDLDHVGIRKDDANLLFRGKENASNICLRQPFPMEDRQYSIPSIRMAHHVNGSTTSYTDEEDDLAFPGYDDDASLSSRGSSLYLPEDPNMMSISKTASIGGAGLLGSTSIMDDDGDDNQGVQKNTSWPVYNTQNKTSVIIEDGLENVVHPSTSNIVDASAMAIAPSARGGMSGSGTTDTDNSSSAGAAGAGGSRKNKRKQISQEERTLQAYQWINSIQLPAEQNVFAEAASSKFLLTGRQPSSVHQQSTTSPRGRPVATSTEVIGGIHRTRMPLTTATTQPIADA